MNETVWVGAVWAGARVGHADEASSVAATSHPSGPEVLVIAALPALSQGLLLHCRSRTRVWLETVALEIRGGQLGGSRVRDRETPDPLYANRSDRRWRLGRERSKERQGRLPELSRPGQDERAAAGRRRALGPVLGDHEPVGGDESGPRHSLERRVDRVLVRRIEEDDREALPRPREGREGPRHVLADDAGAPRHAERLDVGRERAEGLRVAFDEGRVRGAAREGLEPHAARARVEVEHPRPGQPRAERVHERLPHLVGGRPGPAPARRHQASPLELARDHAHGPPRRRGPRPGPPPRGPARSRATRSANGGEIQFAPPPREQRVAEAAMGRLTELRVGGENAERLLARLLQERGVPHQVGDAELWQAGLTGAEDLAGAPEPQVRLGDPEPVVRLDHGGDPLARLVP